MVQATGFSSVPGHGFRSKRKADDARQQRHRGGGSQKVEGRGQQERTRGSPWGRRAGQRAANSRACGSHRPLGLVCAGSKERAAQAEGEVRRWRSGGELVEGLVREVGRGEGRRRPRGGEEAVEACLGGLAVERVSSLASQRVMQSDERAL